MKQHLNFVRPLAVAGSALVLGALLALPAGAQTAAEPAAAPAAAPVAGQALAAKQAIDVRKAAFLLIGNNFKPIGEVLQGHTPYDQAEVQKRATRVAVLAGVLTDAFPDISSSGDTKAKPEIWSNRADFDKRIKDFQDHSAALVQVVAKESSASDAFKTAAAAVGKDCKGCHEDYRQK